MSLFGRIVNTGETPAVESIGGHRLTAWFHEIAGDSGQLGNNLAQRKQAFIDEYSLDAAEQSQLDTLVTWFQAATNKAYFLSTIEACTVMGQAGIIGYLTQTDFNDRLQEARDQVGF